MTLSPEILEKAKEYGEKMRVLQGQYVGTAGRLTMAFEAGAAAMQDSKELELKQLIKIAALCKEEIDHGFDLPSDVFEAVEVYYESVKPPGEKGKS